MIGKRIVLHEIPPSPNNMKARIALGYKQLAYESRPVPLDGVPGDRTALVRLSGQPLTPVLEVDGVVVFDSAGILRFLEANFPGSPRIFSEDYREMKAIEEWEMFGRTALARAVSTCFAAAAAGDADQGRQAAGMLREATGRIEPELRDADFLVGGRLTAADITCASYVATAMVPADADAGPVVRFFRRHFHLGDGRDRTQAWVGRILAHDPSLGG